MEINCNCSILTRNYFGGVVLCSNDLKPQQHFHVSQNNICGHEMYTKQSSVQIASCQLLFAVIPDCLDAAPLPDRSDQGYYIRIV